MTGTLKPSVTITHDFMLAQPSTDSERFHQYIFTDRAWVNLEHIDTYHGLVRDLRKLLNLVRVVIGALELVIKIKGK